MKNYTTQTAALKATTIDTRLLDAKRIDTEKLFVNGVSIDELGGGTFVQVYNASDVEADGWLFTNFDTNWAATPYIGNTPCVFRIIEVKVGGMHVTCPISYEVGNAWIKMWDEGDDLTQIYGGLTADTKIEVIFAIVKNNDKPLGNS